MLRSAVAIAVGYIVASTLILVATLAIDRAHGTGPGETAVNPDALWVLLTFAAQFAGFLVGGYLTGLIAPEDIMRHIAYLVVIALIFGAAGTIEAWSRQPFWYSLIITLLPIPGAIIGGRLRVAQTGDGQSSDSPIG